MIVRFDCYEYDAAAGELRRRGTRVRLRDQPLRVLAELVRHHGEVVTRDELRRALWPDGLVVDFENNLNTAVARLRRVLGDSARRPRYIETLPRRGYRFIAPVLVDSSPEPHTIRLRSRLVVLPFVDARGRTGVERICDALTNEVITELAAVGSDRIAVIARSTSMRYRGTRKDVARIGRELGVDHVVEGSVRSDAGHITITVHLIRTSDQTLVASHRYEVDPDEVLEIRTEIAEAIAAHLAPPIDGGEAPVPSPDRRRAKKPTADLDAYDDYLKGRLFLEKMTLEGHLTAKRYFERAIRRDPHFALAHDAMADAYAHLGYLGHMRPKEAFSVGVSHALAALEIDDDLAEAHAVLAEYHKQLDYDWPAAEREMAKALKLDRGSPIVRLRYAIALLMPQNRLEDAIAEIEATLERDPLSPFARFWLGIMFLLARDAERAIEEARRFLEIEPNSGFGEFLIGCAYRIKYMHEGPDAARRADYEDLGIRAFRRALVLTPGAHMFRSWLGLSLGVTGREAEARSVLTQLNELEGYVPPTAFAFVHLGLREIDAAFEWLERAVEERDQFIMPILSYAMFDPLRSDPRFAGLVRKMNLA